MAIKHTSTPCRSEDWSTRLEEENNFNIRSPQMRDRNQSADIDLVQRMKNGNHEFVDPRVKINFDKGERPNRNEGSLRGGFANGKRSIHTRMQHMYKTDSSDSKMVDTDHYGSISDNRHPNKVRSQYKNGTYGISNSETPLCQDNNEDEALIENATYDDERHSMVQAADRGERLADNKLSPPTPTLYSIHKALVHSIRPFGILIQIEGYQDHGLVQLSEVSINEISTREDPEEAKVKVLCTMANEGEVMWVWVKVISVKVEDSKTRIGCSIKYVNQEDGSDLDPNNTQLEQQSSHPKTLQVEHYKLKFESATAQEEDDTDEMAQRKGKERMMPRGLNSGHMQSCGIPKQLLATGSVGRGRAMVQPAWMKHGIGIGGPPAAASPMLEDEKQSSDVTERVTSMVEEGAAVIARLKEEKRRRKEERQRRRERRHGRSGRGERHKRRRHDEERHGHRRKHRL